MAIFEYPYIIITILVFLILVMGAVGLYFAIQCARTANGVAEKGFLSLNKLKSQYDSLVQQKKKRSLIYAEIVVDAKSKLSSESKVMRVLSQIRPVFLNTFSKEQENGVSSYGKSGFLAVFLGEETNTEQEISKAITEIQKILQQNEAVNLLEIHFGYCCSTSTEVSFEEALSRTKQACAMAEEQHTPYCRWDSNRSKQLEQKIKIENNIQNEIDNNRFFLEYQPILDARTEKIIGAEVLSRLNSQGDGILSPGKFLSAVQSVGLNERFDYYIFEKNCKWIAANPRERQKYVYTINFSRFTLCSPAFVETIVNIAESYGVKLSTLAIEILEDQNLSEEESRQMIQNIARLKECGFLILLDDFGRGYTSFSDLSNFAISIVKIDKAITQEAMTKTGFLILKNILQTAKDLGIQTLCEGIETKEQWEKVVEAGCDMVQGYYFHHPMLVSRLEELLESQDKKTR